MAAAVGAAHRLPSAARLGVVRRNSLRSLRELRSNKAPQVRGTKRAARADPEAALLGAAEGAPRAPGARRRPRPRRLSPPRGTLRGARPPGAPPLGSRPGRDRLGCDPLRPATRTASAVLRATMEPPVANAATVIAKARVSPVPAARPGASPAGRERALCAAEKRSSTGGARSALRSSFSRRVSERSSRSERSEFRRASRCCEHRRAPPRSEGKHPARPRPAGLAPGRAAGTGLTRAFAHATFRGADPWH